MTEEQIKDMAAVCEHEHWYNPEDGYTYDDEGNRWRGAPDPHYDVSGYYGEYSRPYRYSGGRYRSYHSSRKSYGPKKLDKDKLYFGKPAKSEGQLIYFLLQATGLITSKYVLPEGVPVRKASELRENIAALASELCGDEIVKFSDHPDSMEENERFKDLFDRCKAYFAKKQGEERQQYAAELKKYIVGKYANHTDTENAGDKGEDGEKTVTENNDIPGKRYDWSKDFVFTNEIVEDLRRRDCFGIGSSLMIMVPINREDAPNYHSDGNGVIGKDGTVYRYDKETKKGATVPAERHDYEPYDILHLAITVDTTAKEIWVDRYYGHRTDWKGENHTNTHKDYSDLPPISDMTVKSALAVFEDRKICENMLIALQASFDESKKYDIQSIQQSLEFIGGWYDRTPPEEQEKRREELKATIEQLKTMKVQDSPKAYWQKKCQAYDIVASGEWKSYPIKYEEPADPTPEYIKDRAERHKAYADRVNKELSDYYANSNYQGD